MHTGHPSELNTAGPRADADQRRREPLSLIPTGIADLKDRIGSDPTIRSVSQNGVRAYG